MEYHLQEPVYNEIDAYKSDFVTAEKENWTIKTPMMKFLDMQDMVISVELLPDCTEFYELILGIEKHMKNNMVSNGEELFGGELAMEAINDMFKPSFHLPTSIPGLPYMNLTIIKENDKPICRVIGAKGGNCRLTTIKKDAHVILDIHIDGLKYFKGKCEIVYVVDKIKIANQIITEEKQSETA